MIVMTKERDEKKRRSEIADIRWKETLTKMNMKNEKDWQRRDDDKMMIEREMSLDKEGNWAANWVSMSLIIIILFVFPSWTLNAV